MTWINDYRVWLTQSQSLQNAQLIVNYLYTQDKDWSKESLAAMIGNMRHESSVNPNMYEYGYDWSADRGFGLVQWTPRSKYWNWALANGFSESQLRDGDAQLARIDYEVDNNIQYIADGHRRRYGRESKYDFNFAAFRTNSPGLTVNQLTEAFMWNYEGPAYSAGLNSLSERQAFAQRAYSELDWTKGGGSGPGPNPNPDPTWDFNQVIRQVLTILSDGKSDLERSLTVNTDDAVNHILDGLQGLYDAPLYQQSRDFYTNLYFRLTHTFERMMKINPNAGYDDMIRAIVEEAMGMISVSIDIDGVFKDMQNKVNSITPPSSGGGTNPNPNPNETPILPMSPTNLYVTSEYGARNGRLHDGIDFGVGGNPTGQPVYAVMSGTVRAVHNSCDSFNSWGCGGEIGNHITIEHDTDSYTTRYIHLGQNSIPFSVGDKVKQGEQIGVMANSGSSQGIHLHFTVATSYPIVRGDAIDGSAGNTINPRSYIAAIANVPKT